MSHVLIRSRTTRDDHDQGKAIPKSVYMVTSTPYSIVLNTTILYIYASLFLRTLVNRNFVVGLGMAGFNEKEHQNVICCTYLLKVSHYIIPVGLYYQSGSIRIWYITLNFNGHVQFFCRLCLSEWLIGMTMSSVGPPDSLSCCHIYWLRR